MKKNIYITIILVLLLTSCNLKNENENNKINTKDKNVNNIVNKKIDKELNNNLEEGSEFEDNISETGSDLDVYKGEPVVGIKLSGKLFENCLMIFGNQKEDLFDCKMKEIINNEKLNCSNLENIEDENNCNDITKKINEYKKIIELEKIYNKYYELKLF